MSDTENSYIPPEDKAIGDRLFNSPIPLRLEPRDGARYPGFCRAKVPEADSELAAELPIEDTEVYGKRFKDLGDIPPSLRRRDGGV